MSDEIGMGEHGKLNLYHQGWATGARSTLRDTHDRQYYLFDLTAGKAKAWSDQQHTGPAWTWSAISKGSSGVCL